MKADATEFLLKLFALAYIAHNKRNYILQFSRQLLYADFYKKQTVVTATMHLFNNRLRRTPPNLIPSQHVLAHRIQVMQTAGQ